MKTKSLVVLLFAIIACNTSFAWAGVEGGGGGDLCQNRVEEIRNDISDWIQQGGSDKLDFSNSGTTLANYNAKMLSVIALTRLNDQTSISCTDNSSLVQVDGAQKTCVAYPDPLRPRILCYRGETKSGQFVSGFMGLAQDDQYVQIHHEFAVLAGIEDRPGERSDYALSQQISGQLKEELIKMLTVKPISSSACSSQRAQQDARDVGRWMAYSLYYNFHRMADLEEITKVGGGFLSKMTVIDSNGDEVTGYSVISNFGQWKRILMETYVKPLLRDGDGYFTPMSIQLGLNAMFDSQGLNRYSDSDSITDVFCAKK